MRRRIRGLMAAMLALAIALGAVLADASRRRDGDREGARMRGSLAASIGLADLAMSSDARWLRHPSQAEPGAALSDAPGALDVDPAGAWIGPPREVLGGIGTSTTIEVR